MHSLGVMKAEYSELPVLLRSALFAQLAELEKEDIITAHNISNTLYGLAKMNAKYDELPEQGRQCLLRIVHKRADSLKDQGLAMTYYR